MNDVSRRQAESASEVPSLDSALRNALRIIVLLKPHWADFRSTVLLRFIIAVISLAPPLIARSYFDTAYPARDTELVTILIVGTATASVLSLIVNAFAAMSWQLLDAKAWGALSHLYFEKLQCLPIEFYETHQVGELLSRYGDLRASLTAVMQLLTGIVNGAFYLIVIPVVMVAINWRLAAVALIAVPISAATASLSAKLANRYWGASAERSAELAAFQFEMLANIRTLRSLSAEEEVCRIGREKLESALSAQLNAANLSALLGSVTGAVSVLGSIMFTGYAWQTLIQGALSMGEFMVFTSYLALVTPTLAQVSTGLGQLQHVTVSLARAFTYLDVRSDAESTERATGEHESHHWYGSLSLDSVSYAYANGKQAVKEVSVTFEPGTKTAIVGASGAGKSTFLKLFSRQIDPSSGTITLDGVPLSALESRRARELVTTVNQDTSLLRGTIRDNIAFGLREQTVDLELRINKAIGVCQLRPILEQLPQGLHTAISEAGASLSGGQRQRICIARAVVRAGSVLVLDEATSALDAQSEIELLTRLFDACKDRTVIFTTHRIQTARLADKICVLDDGRLVAVGTHTDLQESCLPYRLMAQYDPDIIKATFDDPRGQLGREHEGVERAKSKAS